MVSVRWVSIQISKALWLPFLKQQSGNVSFSLWILRQRLQEPSFLQGKEAFCCLLNLESDFFMCSYFVQMYDLMGSFSTFIICCRELIGGNMFYVASYGYVGLSIIIHLECIPKLLDGFAKPFSNPLATFVIVVISVIVSVCYIDTR